MRHRPILCVLMAALWLSPIAIAQSPIPAVGLCNTGLTAASPLPVGCTGSTLVTPVNPQSGGSSVDGNWELATPYPSAAYDQVAPNPCALTFGPAWVDAPASGWFNPSDGLSQWITPESDGPNTVGGWYVYRTSFPVPSAQPGSKYVLTVRGQEMADDENPGILLGRQVGNSLVCSGMALPPLVSSADIGSSGAEYGWQQFHFAVLVEPSSTVYLYFVVYNIPFPQGRTGNYTGFRVEFTSATLTLE